LLKNKVELTLTLWYNDYNGGINMIRKPPKKEVGCETCEFSVGKVFEDKEIKDLQKIYCKARHVDVDVVMMGKYCDFFKIKSKEKA